MTVVLKYVVNNFILTWLGLYLFKCSKYREQLTLIQSDISPIDKALYL